MTITVAEQLARTTTTDVDAIKRNALQLSLVAISSVFVFEFVAGILTNSLALVTDGAHALLDAVITGILIIAVTLALKPRDIDHTYGHGKIETIGGLIGGIALFVVAIFFIYVASMRIVFSEPAALANAGTVGFAAVFYTIAVDGFRMTVLQRAMRRTKMVNGTSILKADFYHAFADLASTAVAFIGIWLATAGFAYGDSAAALVLGVFLAYLSSRLAYQNAMELTDVVSPKLVATVRQAANSTEGVLECSDVKMRRVGRDTFVEATITMSSDRSFESAHEISAQVESNIGESLSRAGLDIDPRNITVHFEPRDNDLPLESVIERVTTRVSGVRGVHNVIVSRIGGTDSIGISLHIQVNRSATLSQAHSIANAVEEAIKARLKNIDNITVHLEPLMPEMTGIELIADTGTQDTIREIVATASDVKSVGRIAAYRAENVLKIDVSCAFNSDMAIEEIHERVSEIEKQIRARHPGSVVTVHAEPTT